MIIDALAHAKQWPKFLSTPAPRVQMKGLSVQNTEKEAKKISFADH